MSSTEDGATEVATDDPATDSPAEDTDELRSGLLAELRQELGDGVVGDHLQPGQDLWVRVAPAAWRTAAEVASHRLTFTYFAFLSAIDWLPSPYGRDEDAEVDQPAEGNGRRPPSELVKGVAGGDTRFQVFARVVSPSRKVGVTFKADVAEPELRVDSWVPVYAGADWHERETWEMYGIEFVGHPGLRHIYLPGEFEGFPLRKDFPLLARQVKPWPGIVDVEPMPGDAEDEADVTAADPTEAAPTEEGES